MKQSLKTTGWYWVLIFSMCISTLNAQISTLEVPYSLVHELDLRSIPSLAFPFTEKMIDHEAAGQTYPMYAGTSIPVDIRFADKASATVLEDGSTLWRLRIEARGAPLMGLVFRDFVIRGNDKLFIYDDSGQHHIGAFTRSNNHESGIFSTHILPVSALIIEYHATDPGAPRVPTFSIEEIVYILHPPMLLDDTTPNKSSGECNVNVNCPEGRVWQKQKRGVARILLRSGNSWFNCTGTLINNTSNDGTPYFLTSDHCGTNASDDDLQAWQFYFNYEHESCSSSGIAPQNQMLSGATVVAKGGLTDGTDFKLLQLNNTPPASYNPYYNGWTRSARDPEAGASIHHPSGDAKKISTYTIPLTSATFPNGMNSGFWRVVWEETESGHGVTEGGSSGSPLFNQYGLVTGTLTGGGASCSSPLLPDYYGKFYMHWQSNGETDDKRLSPWLDPENEDIESLFGYDPLLSTNFVIVEINPALSGMVMGAGYYAENENVELVAEANEGFTFTAWTNLDGQVISDQQQFEFLMPQSEIVLIANFSATTNNVDPGNESPIVEVYPNPAISQVSVTIHPPTEKTLIHVVNITGQTVMEPIAYTPGDHPGKKISLNGLTPGVYFLLIESDKIATTHKLIINPQK
ncbi:MAG: InlB B-repeat-containing protein [Bacteroidota bacterium]